ncbi:MAG: 2'-5' RNA ligase family protein [Clostridia bacterium]|nr:2'-5' RNA ligase family protein [Clostridia bacterium]
MGKRITLVTLIDEKELINQLKIAKGGKNNSWILYLGIKDNEDMKRLQQLFYKEFPNERFKNIFYKDATDEKYNPDNSIFHMTLHIDENYEKVQYIYEKLKEDFKPFLLEFSKLVLFDYPGEKIKEFDLKNKTDI